MAAFKNAPWFLKLLLAVLPLLFLLRTVAFGQLLAFTVENPGQSPAFWLLATVDCLSVFVLALATYFAWRQRSAARWLVALAFALLVGNAMYQHFVPSAGGIQLPRVPVDESRMGFQFGTFLMQMAFLWWAYMCVFSERAVRFFDAAKAGAH